MRLVVSLLTFLLVSLIPNQGLSFELFEVRELSLEYIDYFDGGRAPLITSNGLSSRGLGKSVNLNLDIDIAKYFYFNNFVHSMTDQNVETGSGQFRAVGWQSEVGARPFSFLEVFYHHHSQHTLDHNAERLGGFPVEDGVGFRLVLIRRMK